MEQFLNSYSEIYGPLETTRAAYEREGHVESDGERGSAVYKYLGIHFSL